jgi:hypothetical protein
VFVGRTDSPESRSLGLTDARLLSLSRSGEMAVQLNSRFIGGFRWSGTLGRISLAIH